MEVSVKTLFEAKDIFSKLLAAQLRPKKALEYFAFVKRANDKLEDVEKIRMGLFKTYGEESLNDAGNPVYKIKPENVNAFSNEMMELNNEIIPTGLTEKITREELEKANITFSVNELFLIEPFIKLED